MTPVHADSRREALVDDALGRVAVGVLLRQELYYENWMIGKEPIHFLRLMRGSVVYEKYDPPYIMALCVGCKAGQMLPEFDIPSPGKDVPDNVLLWPEQRDEAVYTFCVAKGLHNKPVSLRSPAPLYLGQQFNPFLILESYCDAFFKSAGAMRL